ncbi:TPA: reverse transcriptase domain-containing protein [Photobacterium damselae]
MPNILNVFISDATIDSAYAWVCKNRNHYPPNADIWDLQFHWEKEREKIKQQLLSGKYQFKPLQIITRQDKTRQDKTRQDKTTIALWDAKDALVIKMLTLTLSDYLPVHEKCEHIKGNGGGKQSALKINKILQQGEYHFVCRTDIKGYYANINKTQLLAQLNPLIQDDVIFNLLIQFVHYIVEDGGTFHTPEKGIARGNSLSPLIGAFHLYIMDVYFSKIENIYYARYMDDFIIFTKTRWQLRKAVKKLNQFFNQFSFKQHPDKTFIGRIDKGFDWMGFQFARDGIVDIAPRSLKKILENIQRLYEQAPQRVAEYVNRSLSYFIGNFRTLTSGVPATGTALPNRILSSVLIGIVGAE